MRWISEEYILSGTHTCSYSLGGNSRFLVEMTWILVAAWEVLALALAIWISVKHFHELHRQSMGWAVGDYFTILMKTHIFYFARWGLQVFNIFYCSNSTPVLLLFLAFSSALSLQRSRYANLWLAQSAFDHRYPFNRDWISWAQRSLTVLFKSPKLYSSMCWDHVLSWPFDDITLSSWTTPILELVCLQLLLRSPCTRQRGVMWMCSTGNAYSARSMRIFVIGFFVVLIWCSED